jgi:hypothetical protein
MSDQDDIPVLHDLIESGAEITLSDLGLDDDPVLGANNALTEDITIDIHDVAPIAYGPGYQPIERDPIERDPIEISPALEQTVRRILDEHMELAWQEIRLAILQHLDRS